jgi:hypothetical protein
VSNDRLAEAQSTANRISHWNKTPVIDIRDYRWSPVILLDDYLGMPMVLKKVAQNVAQLFFVKINTYITCTVKTSCPKKLRYFCNFQNAAQSEPGDAPLWV